MIAGILRLDGPSKPRIMSNANLSHGVMQKHVDFLIGRGFADVVDEQEPYRATEKGRTLLQGIDAVLAQLSFDVTGTSCHRAAQRVICGLGSTTYQDVWWTSFSETWGRSTSPINPK